MAKDITKLRGQGTASKDIFQKVRQITEEKGTDAIYNRPSRIQEQGGGAFASMNKRKSTETLTENIIKTNNINSGGLEIETIKKVDLNKYLDTLYESLVILNETKDYSSVVRGLFTYYCSGKMNDYILEGVSLEDKQELLGIIEDFKQAVKNTLK
jgi:hypothetical protein